MNFLSKIKQVLSIQTSAFFKSDSQIQDYLAPLLRKTAIEHLAYSEEVVAKSFRGEYFAAEREAYQDFLEAQAKKGVWGTYIEATALGEALGCQVVVTPVTAGKAQKPICLYRAANEKAPAIHLYNSDNTHWYQDEKTKGNGDCLYNAFAQALQQLVKPDLRFEVNKSASPLTRFSSLFANSFSKEKMDKEEVAHQKRIENSVTSQALPRQMQASFESEKQRIAALPAVEQKQIEKDYKLALKLAREELGYVKNSFCAFATEKDNESVIAAQMEGLLSY